MGISCAPDIFQEKLLTLMVSLNFARTYLDDLLCLTKGNLYDHLNKLCVILNQLKVAGLKCNAEKSSFCQTQIEYLGY